MTDQPHGQEDRSTSPDRHHPDVGGAGEAADRITTLAHELNNLLDGSMRWLMLASRALSSPAIEQDSAGLEAARERIDTVQRTLAQMAVLIDAAMRAVPIGSAVNPGGVSVAQAIDHAVEVVRPRAMELAIDVAIRIERDAGVLPAGPLYVVVLNGLINAIESIEACGERGGGVEVSARLDDAQRLVIEIIDDGAGPPDDGARAFDHGWSTKPRGTGIGLSICRALVERAGGQIELSRRHERGHAPRHGAVLRVTAAVQRDRVIG